MKRCLLSLAAAACLFLASCSFQSGSELLDSSLLAAPVPEELTQSELWQQAVHSGSLISYEEEPITTKAMAEEATASLAKKGGTVEMYQFSGSGDTAACTRILCKNTGEEITLSRSETQDWITSAEPEQTNTLTEPQLTRYGFFTAQTGSGEDFGFRAVNDAELYGNTADLRQLYDTYLKPIAATAIGEKTWSSPEEAGDLLMLAEDIAWAVDGISFRETYPDGWIPVNYLVETLSRYFDGIDRRAVVYTVYDFDYASDCMHYTFERDYEAELPRVRVLSAHEQEELLRISYCLYDPCTGEPLPDSSRVLSVRPQEDGSFRYMSNLMA